MTQSARARILVVDDDPVLRRLYRRILGERFYLTVRSGADRLQPADAEGVALVITDLEMPGGGGEAVLERVRGWGLQVPVLIVTGAPRSSAWCGAGCSVLGKPFLVEELLERVERALLRPGPVPPPG